MRHIINFSKMHGLGNDFLVIDGTKQFAGLSSRKIKQLAHRQTGIGFDQLLLIGHSTVADFSCRIFNSDGSEAKQCGNGMRCAALFILQENLSQKKVLRLQTLAGIIPIKFKNPAQITVEMGPPSFQPAEVPFLVEKEKKIYLIEAIAPVPFSVASIGNPHAILQVPSIKTDACKYIANSFSSHALFPQGVNIGFMQIVSPDRIKLRTFERGVGETLSCGSNACAAVATGIRNRWLVNCVNVELKLGDLIVEWSGRKTSSMLLTGEAEKVFSGTIKI